MSATENLNGEQFSDWARSALDPQGPLRQGLQEEYAQRGPRMERKVAGQRVDNYCTGCGVHQPVNPGTFKCPTCTDKAYDRMSARI